MIRKVRITTDGDDRSTHVFDENGEKIHGITRIELTIFPGSPVLAHITIIARAQVDAEVNAEMIAV